MGRPAAGFTLLEVVITLGVLLVIVALMSPTLAGLIQSDRERQTQQQAEQIFRAIFGDPRKGEFGYVGDMGRLPAALSELVDQGSQLAFHTSDGPTEHVGRVGTGWRGPYLGGLFSSADLFKDAWGQPFAYSASGGTAGQIISGGPDGQTATTGDNIVFPLHPPASTGSLFVSVVANRIPNAFGATAKLYSPVNGEQTVTPTQKNLPASTTFDGFAFENVVHGLHVLVVAHTGAIGDTTTCVTVTRTLPLSIHGGQQVVKEVRLLSAADVKVTENPCTIPD